MNAASDHELLRRYADLGSDDAFTELVNRHCNLVWAAARRISGDGELARDVAQTVFSDLARKAGSLPAGTLLAGWLYRAACHAAANHLRGEARRAHREQLAMQHTLQPSDATEARSAADLQPVLDAALASLSETDRDAVVLRYLTGRNLAEVGAALGTNEDAAQKRVSRALERLRDTFRQRGVPVSGAVVATALGIAGTQMAPAGLAATVATGALAGAGATAGTASILLLMKSKLTLGIVGGAAVIAALTWQQRNVTRLTAENSTLRGQLEAASAIPAPSATTDRLEAPVLGQLRAQQEELLRLRGEVAQLRQAAHQTGGKSPPGQSVAAGDVDAQVNQMLIAEATSTRLINAMKHLGLAARMFSTDHGDRFPSGFDDLKDQLAGTSAAEGTLPGGVPMELVEFFPHERAVSAAEPQMILFREKTPRRLPNGTWERIYCLSDGSVQRVNRADGNFDEFELAGTGTPANAPKQP